MKSLVILAGGKSSRMGQDKVLLEFDGRSFIERIYLNALEYFERIIISTDSQEHAGRIRELPVFKGRDVETVIDRYEGFGPIGGIASVFESSDARRFAIISTDVPLAEMRVLEALYDRCVKKAAWLKMEGSRPEPLIAAYDRSAYEDIKASLDKGLFKMRQVFKPEDVDIIRDCEIAGQIPGLEISDIADAFRNCNTPEEYLMLMKGN